MSDGGVQLSVVSLSKTFGKRKPVVALRDLSFDVRPGRVTGFLGPNGSGKTTTLRCLLGLVSPTSGEALVGGIAYSALADPKREVGAALEASGFHPGRSARNHLRVVAAVAGISDARVDETLRFVGLTATGRRRVGGYSLGMRQRLSLAEALLGDPAVLILDEPANGLDPEGIAWLRTFLRAMAAEGRTVLISSHVLSEVQQTVDDVVIINEGRLVYAGTLEALAAEARPQVTVRSPAAEALAAHLRAESTAGAHVEVRADGSVAVGGLTSQEIGHIAFLHGIELHELSASTGDLERVFLDLTTGDSAGGTS